MVARPITGTDAPMRLSGVAPGVNVVWVGKMDEDGVPTTGTGIRVSVGMAFLLFLLGDGQRGEELGIPLTPSWVHHVPATVQPKFQQSFLFMFWRCPRLSSRSECRTFQLYAELATKWWCSPFALCLVRQWIMSCVCSGVLLDVFSTRLWYSATEVDSVLLSRVGGRARRPWLWYVLTGFAGYGAPRPVFPSILLA